MKKAFIISCDTLKPVLKKLGQAINSKAIIPALKNIKVEVSEKQIELTTCDLELTVIAKLEAETSGAPFELLLPFDFLSKIVSESGVAPLTVEHPSTRKANITCNSDLFQLQSLDKLEEYPKVPAVPQKNSMPLINIFMNMLDASMLTTAKEEHLNQSMHRACLDIDKDGATLVSTDALSMFTYALPIKTDEPTQLSISPRMAQVMEGSTDVQLSWTTQNLAMKSGIYTVMTKRHEDKFPNYKAVLQKVEPNLIMARHELEAVLKKACISSDKTTRTSMLLKQTSGFIEFDVEDVDMSRKIHLSAAGTYTGECEAIAVNARKLLTIVKQINTPNISLSITSPKKALMVSSPEDTDYYGLLMPIMPTA